MMTTNDLVFLARSGKHGEPHTVQNVDPYHQETP
jgi:hypothetical protein